MEQVVKHYKVTKYCQYEEVALIGNVSGLTKQPNYGSIVGSNGYACSVDTWLDDETGEGWEIRTFVKVT